MQEAPNTNASSQRPLLKLFVGVVNAPLFARACASIATLAGIAALLYGYGLLGGLLLFLAGILFGGRATSELLQSLFPNVPSADVVSAAAQELTLLRTSMHRYGVLIDNLVASVVIRDAQGNINYCSPYTEVLTGYPLEAIYATEGDFFLSIVHEEDRERYLRAMKVTSAGEPFQYKCRYFHKSGIEIWVETRTVPVIGTSGEILFSLSVTLDVTGTIRYQRQVEEKNKDLQDFTYMVSHDLKAPIFTIKGMIGILQEDLKDHLKGDAAETITHITGATARLEQLVGSVLHYARLSTQEIPSTEVNLSDVLSEVSSDLAAQIKDAHGELVVPVELPIVFGDKVRMYQVFSNLIGNAVKYRSQERPLKIEVILHPSRISRTVSIEIKDNGEGIAPDKLEGIFRPFQRAHSGNVEGLGIGLASVKKILDKCGGRIETRSAQGVGSSFIVTLRAPHGEKGAERDE